MTLNRRAFLRRAAISALIPSSVGGLVAACAGTDAMGPPSPPGGSGLRAPDNGGYGPLLEPVGGAPLALPRDFRVRAFGTAGDRMSDAHLTPIGHDGMAAFALGAGRVRLIRNHEDRNPPGASSGPVAGPGNAYDSRAGGGTTTLEIGPNRELLRDFVTLNGTIVNCAGGPTPWGSWLSCEESTQGPREGWTKAHGYVFEVPASAERPVEPRPIRGMGRFRHEAAAVDPSTGTVYETEDNGFPPGSGFYRYVPDTRLRRAGGRLQMLAVETEPNLLMFHVSDLFVALPVSWVDIDEPDPLDADLVPEVARDALVFSQGEGKGGAVFNRLEGCWYGDGNIFFHDTAGGRNLRGQVWQYNLARETVMLIFDSPGSDLLDGPDNITVSPRGNIVICEDGGGIPFLRGLTRNGRIFDLARNVSNDSEFAGATFSPDGETLFVNVQGATVGTPDTALIRGMTLAIWGPWRRGLL